MTTTISIVRASLFALVAIAIVNSSVDAAEPKLYFPPADGKWETVKPSDAGWDKAKLQAALDYAGKNRSSGVVILYRGRILAEQHWMEKKAGTAKFRRRNQGRTKAGHAIEDVASVQKSIAGLLIGIAQEKGLLKIDDAVSKHLGKGWTKATAEQEAAITIRHLLTMSSGLTDAGRFEAKPGEKWRYNTWAYAKTMDVLEKVTKQDRNKLTADWLTKPLGMTNSKWVRRGAALQSVNGYGFATTARDLARVGLLMLADGRWGKQTILGDSKYLKAATTSSQKRNPFYGYLWWVNRNKYSRLKRARRMLTAPRDMYSANGALNRRCWVVPSLQLVVTRLGDRPTDGRSFDRKFWSLLREAKVK